MSKEGDSQDEWKQMWDARETALKSVLGPTNGRVFHAIVPFNLGGQADVLCFPKHIPGYVYATCELLGEPSQKRNLLGTYELMIAQREPGSWAPNLLSRLARYTCDALLEPGHTMDIGPATPKGSTITGFLFADYGRLDFQDTEAGLLLCVGLTADELALCRQGKRQEVVNALKSAGVYPYTDLFRPSTTKPPKGGFWRRLKGGA